MALETEDHTAIVTWTAVAAGKTVIQNISSHTIRLAFGAEPTTEHGEILYPGDGRIVDSGEIIWVRSPTADVTISVS